MRSFPIDSPSLFYDKPFPPVTFQEDQWSPELQQDGT